MTYQRKGKNEKRIKTKKTGTVNLIKGQEGAAEVGKDAKTLTVNKTKSDTTIGTFQGPQMQVV